MRRIESRRLSVLHENNGVEQIGYYNLRESEYALLFVVYAKANDLINKHHENVYPNSFESFVQRYCYWISSPDQKLTLKDRFNRFLNRLLCRKDCCYLTEYDLAIDEQIKLCKRLKIKLINKL